MQLYDRQLAAVSRCLAVLSKFPDASQIVCICLLRRAHTASTNEDRLRLYHQIDRLVNHRVSASDSKGGPVSGSALCEL